MTPTVESRVIECVAIALTVSQDQVNASSNLEKDLGADSLDRFELTMDLEDEFAIEIPDEEGAACHTVQDCVNLVRRYRKDLT